MRKDRQGRRWYRLVQSALGAMRRICISLLSVVLVLDQVARVAARLYRDWPA
jgi:hypothetical protein